MKSSVFLLSALFGLASAVQASDGGSFRSKLDADLYGYFKLDACYDSAPVVNGDFAKWVAPGGGGEDDFSGTVNQTRAGLRVRGPAKGRLRASALVEIDFYGGTEDPDPRIRHAYLELSWPGDGVDLLIGQSSDVISPLFPATLNYSVAWWAGNVGFRRPQVRLRKRFYGKGPIELELEGALTHNVYDTQAGPLRGEDAGFPALQARAGLTFPASASRTMTIGLSGHRAEEDFEIASGGVERVGSWSVNLDVRLPVSAAATLTGELFSGSGLAPYLGGVGQGVDPATCSGIRSRGGWLSLSVAPGRGKLKYNFGLSIDDADDEDLAAGSRTSNQSIFGNAVYAFSEEIDVGLELSRWLTEYEGLDDGEALRVQAAFVFKF